MSGRKVFIPTVRRLPALLVLLIIPAVTSAATYTVTKTGDTNDGACDADCSLREAITAANASAGNTIAFDIDGATDLGCTGAGPRVTSYSAICSIRVPKTFPGA